jgi:hypothetical protein
MGKRRSRRVAPVLHLQTPCGGSLPPAANAWTLATSRLPPHVAPRRCDGPACWVARRAPRSLCLTSPSWSLTAARTTGAEEAERLKEISVGDAAVSASGVGIGWATSLHRVRATATSGKGVVIRPNSSGGAPLRRTRRSSSNCSVLHWPAAGPGGVDGRSVSVGSSGAATCRMSDSIGLGSATRRASSSSTIWLRTGGPSCGTGT